VWHASNTPASSPLGILDHAFAAAWLAADVYYYAHNGDISILILNALVFLSNIFVGYLDNREIVPYRVGHSVWHIFSWVKSIIVATKI
jgi:hypothetical protein